MKKLFNNRFLFILAISLVVLILLVFGAFYLFDDEDNQFVKSGYILNPLSTTSEKYFFNEDIGYKENLSSMIEFKDIDENVVSVLKDSFIHYLDESMSFLKNGAILDLDSVKGDKAVSFYNITRDSIILKKDNGYVIESANGDIKLNNFIGRISDNKYIVVGDLSLKMAGNSTNVKGDYFEVVYVEEGIVNIENKSVKYQVTAEDTLIYVGNDKVIDLGDKKITVNGEDIMSITSITIDGNENIEIVPKEETPKDNNGGDTDGTNNNNGENNGNGSTNDDPNNGGTGNENTDGEITDDVTISLKDAKIGSTNIDVIFDVINAKDDDKFMLQVVNLTSGRTVDMVAEVLSDVLIQVNLLTPNTKYLFIVVNEKDNGKYFQKVFETTGFGIKLEKTYATDSSLSYKVTIDKDTDITNAKLSLYKFNEETKKNEIVKTSYFDSLTGETKYVEKITYLSSMEGSITGEYEVLYDGLENNTIYTAVLDEFSVASSNFKDIYNITVTSMTLKKTPIFSEMIVTKDKGKGSFDLSLGNITDPDNAITSYTYMIYDKLDNTMAINPIVKTNASPITVSIGDDVNELKNDTNYYYKVIIEYFDNEKYIEYVTTDSITFVMGSEPYVTVVPKDELISYDSIGATIYLKDNSCAISMPGREKCNGSSTTILDVTKVNPITGEKTSVFTKLIEFEVTEKEIKYELYLNKLQAGTTYNIELRAKLNSDDSDLEQEILHTDESKRTITTKSLTSFINEWTDMTSSANHVVNVQSKFIADDNTGTMSGDASAAAIKKVVVSLYEGNNINDLQNVLPIAAKSFTNTEDFNIKENFYDNGYTITTDGTFGLTIDALKNFSKDGKLSEYYTVLINAYYDVAGKNEVQLSNNILAYKISPVLLMDNIEEPVLKIEYITNSASGKIFDNLTNGGTHVGYSIFAAFDRAGLLANQLDPQRINFYVYNGKKEKLKFYVKDEDGKLVLVDKITGDLGESNYYETDIYMDYGTEYEINDDIMSRGNEFYIGYEIETVSDDGILLYPATNDKDYPSDYGLYEKIVSEKETPVLKMYIAKSDNNSITYSYSIKDPDSSLYRESNTDNYGFYTIINNGNEVKLDLTKTDGDYNQFEGRITVPGLSNGDLYSIYYKKNISKTGDFSTDVVNYLDGEDNGMRLFDGYYDAKEEEYNFKYEIINNQLVDNKVVIKILASEEMLSRIVSYRINFSDSKGNKLDKELWQLSTCSGEEDLGVARCLSVDYTELKSAGMKSDKENVNLISVKVDALYDNGITGYDYKVGNSDDSDYKYIIMQNNNTESGLGNYVSYSSSGQVTVWSNQLGVSKGYYTYNFNNSLLYYKSELNRLQSSYISVNLSSVGYSSKYGILNPKMISIDMMNCDNNTFSFNSITPKISVSEKTSLINGSIMDLTLSGIDLNDLKNEGTDGKPKYYLYVETWNNIDNVGNLEMIDRPTLKIEIDNSNPGKTVLAIIDGLLENSTYYFNVYVNMYKDNRIVYTQLFDAGFSDRYETKTYKFTTLKSSDIFHNFDVSYKATDEVYGNRVLNTKINLLAYKNDTPFNFDLVYVLCNIEDFDECGPNDGDKNIFKKVVSVDDLTTNVLDSVDISEYDLEYDKDYYMYIYANVDFYNNGSEDSKIKRNVVLNRYSINVKLRKLIEPSFVVTRNASLENGEYFIDLNIVVNDPDRTLVDGEYYIKLIDSDGNIVGNMQLLDNDGNYYDVANYDDYAFDALVVNKKVRITGLDANTKYSFVIYNNAYLNNYVEDTLPGAENRTYMIKKSYTVYSTNDYGVAFGKDILYSATEKSIIVTFLGGSNFDNVVEVNYTIGLWDDEENTSTSSGTFVIGEDNKRFELYKNTDDWRFVIDPSGMKNILGKTYTINLSFKVKIPGTEDFVVLTSADNPMFEGRTQYVEDESK